jgi:hypothetical protein
MGEDTKQPTTTRASPALFVGEGFLFSLGGVERDICNVLLRQQLKGGLDLDDMDEDTKQPTTPTQPVASPANAVKDAAQTLLAHLLKFVHDFPSTLGTPLFLFT